MSNYIAKINVDKDGDLYVPEPGFYTIPEIISAYESSGYTISISKTLKEVTDEGG